MKEQNNESGKVDKIHNEISGSERENKENSSPIRLYVIIQILGSILGIMGELLPDNLKNKLITLSGNEYRYDIFWICFILLVNGLFIYLSLRFERLSGLANKGKVLKSGKLIITNYRAIIYAKRPLWKKILYSYFSRLQPDADFIRALGLSKGEENFYIRALNAYSPLHFTREQNGEYEETDIVTYLSNQIAGPEGGFFLLMSESGCGKTTILYKLLCEYAKRHKKHQIIIREFRKGYEDILLLQPEDQKNTILLLDGLDEDLETIRNPQKTFATLGKQLQNFKFVVLSSRLQLFKDHAEEPGVVSQFMEFEHLYLDILSPTDTKEFLSKKFNVKKGIRGKLNKHGKANLEAALKLINDNNRFEALRRPFLLQQIEMLIPDTTPVRAVKGKPVKKIPQKFIFEYQIYELLIYNWIEREATIIAERIMKKNDHEEVKYYFRILQSYSRDVAAGLYAVEQDALYAYNAQYREIIENLWKNNEKGISQTHSLLTRDADGKFQFAHRAIFEYFLAESLYDCKIEESSFLIKKGLYPISHEYYNAMCWYRLGGVRDAKKLSQDDKNATIWSLNEENDCFSYIEKWSSAGSKPVFYNLIQQNSWMSVRALILKNLSFFDNSHIDDSLFLVIDAIVNDQLNKNPAAYQYLFECAKGMSTKHMDHLDKRELMELKSNTSSASVSNLFNDKSLPINIRENLYAGTFQFVHPVFSQYFRLAKFTGHAFRTDKTHFTTSVAPDRSFIPEKSLFFPFEDHWVAESKLFNRLKFYESESGDQCLNISKIAFYDLFSKRHLYLRNSEITDAELEKIWTFFPYLDILDLRNNQLTEIPAESLLPNNERFKMFLEGNLYSQDQKRTLLDNFRCYLKETTVIDFHNSLGLGDFPEMVHIPGGTFTMGDTDFADAPPHQVTVSPFLMGKFPVTVRQFAAFIAANPSFQTSAEKLGWSWTYTGGGEWGGEKVEKINWRHDSLGDLRPDTDWDHPVIHVSWYDVIAYANWLSIKEGLKPVYEFDADEESVVIIHLKNNGYRLPTEAEWEFAAGNGVEHTKYSWGNEAPMGKQGGNLADEYKQKLPEWRWLVQEGYNSGYLSTSPVGSFKPNQFHLYDMSGNVWEWCNDFCEYTDDKVITDTYQDGITDPLCTTGSDRVMRGGSWYGHAVNCRVSRRGYNLPGFRYFNVGFRLLRTE